MPRKWEPYAGPAPERGEHGPNELAQHGARQGTGKTFKRGFRTPRLYQGPGRGTMSTAEEAEEPSKADPARSSG